MDYFERSVSGLLCANAGWLAPLSPFGAGYQPDRLSLRGSRRKAGPPLTNQLGNARIA